VHLAGQFWRGLATGLILSGLGAHAAWAAPPPVVEYRLAPELVGGAIVALDVTIRFQASANGTTRLDLPDKAAGDFQLSRQIRDVQVDGAQSVSEDGPAVRAIRSAPGARLAVRYRVVSAFDHDPSPAELDTYKPTVLRRWFWAYGESIFALPELPTDRVRFAWAAPLDLPFASNLQSRVDGAMSFAELQQSVVVGGPDLRVTQAAVDGAPVQVAMIGQYGFSDAAFADITVKIIAAERGFWGTSEAPFLVVLAPLGPSSVARSTRGEGRGDAFAVMTTTNVTLDDLRMLIAHEYFHTWNPRRLGALEDDDQERAGYWFSEGFTDFYARRLLLRAGVFSLGDFVAEWNSMLLAYAESPVATEPNTRIVNDFWNDPNVEKLPYQRGAILAALWDQRLRQQSRARVSLDDLMRAQRLSAATQPATPAPQLFRRVARRYGLDVAGDLAVYVTEGRRIVLSPDVFGACIVVKFVTMPSFDRGFDIDATGRTGIVAGVAPGSAAYRAGLRDGMTFVRREGGKVGDSRVPYVVRIKDGSGERLISYRPEGDSQVTFQELAVSPGLSQSDRAACAKAVAER
jgi:predicted metalloprotease with PDZ domain